MTNIYDNVLYPNDLDGAFEKFNITRIYRFFILILVTISLCGFSNVDAYQFITIKSFDHKFFIRRGYFIYPPPLDGILNKSRAEAFIVDYPDFRFQSEFNRDKFSALGSPYVVTFLVHFAPTLSVQALLNVRLETLSKNNVGHLEPSTKLLTFRAKDPRGRSEKDIYVDPTADDNFIECASSESVPFPRCQMHFDWNNLIIDADFNLDRINEQNTIKRNIIDKLKCWQEIPQKQGRCDVK